MTIEERLCFIRAGYSAQDIAAFEAAESKPAADPADDPAADQADDPAADPAPADDPAADPAEDPADDPAPAEDIPAWAKALKASLDEVKKTIQSDNRRFDDMGDDDSIEDAAENALAKYITGKVPEKSNNRGGKRK